MEGYRDPSNGIGASLPVLPLRMFLLLTSALASDSGLQLVFDREVACQTQVDPAPDPSTCKTVTRRAARDADQPTWAIVVAPPGKLFVATHTPDIDWARVSVLQSPRAFEPILITAGVKPDPVCDGEKLQFAHVDSVRGPATSQFCVGHKWAGHGEVLLPRHADLPTGRWVPLWTYQPDDEAAAAVVRNRFLVQIYISMDGKKPEQPADFPYASVQMLNAAVPRR